LPFFQSTNPTASRLGGAKFPAGYIKSTFHGASNVEAARVVVDEITVVGSRCGRFAPAIDLLARGAVDVSPFVSEIVSLDRGVDAMALAAKDGVMKVLLAENA